MENLDLLKAQALEYGNLDFSIITKRPEGMPSELYKFMRKSSNKVIEKYLNGTRDVTLSKVPKKIMSKHLEILAKHESK
jgi:hypothetical protein